IKPSQPTEVLIGYDSEFLYVGFRAQDDPRKVRAPVCERDDLSGSDYVGIYLDSFNDKRKAKRRAAFQIYRSHIVFRGLPYAGRSRRVLGKALGRRGRRTMWLA